ncbi:MAG: EamA family transporter RarD [Actinomycetes bacterium]
MSVQRRGLVYAVTAYLIWGLFPLYWPLLEPAGALEILADRFVWSLVVLAIILLATRHVSWIPGMLADRRRLGLLMGAAVLITINWGTYIYGVNSNQVVQTSLGYFINPLVTVVLAAIVLHERLTRTQWAAVGLAGIAVVVLTVGYGTIPVLALVLAFSFGGYGLAKKVAQVAAVPSLTVETTTMLLPALVYAVVIQVDGRGTFGHGVGHTALLMGAGLVTVVPLLAFAGAATRIPLATIGVLQYLTPTIQLLIGLFVDHEPFPASHLVGFALVWLALAVFSVDGVRRSRTTHRPALSPEVLA